MPKMRTSAAAATAVVGHHDMDLAEIFSTERSTRKLTSAFGGDFADEYGTTVFHYANQRIALDRTYYS
jgi:hypothetical protein